MTDILIKSFNRPYYLDRCLQSIYLNVKGNFRITIMDDGTPEQYLTKLQQTYPEIQISYSANYLKKVNLVQNLDAAPNKAQQQIPVELWINCVRQSSNVFLLLEEDSWFTEGIELDELVNLTNQYNLNIVKLGWNGNSQTVYGEKKLHHNTIEEIIPSLPLTNPLLVSILLKNTFKVRSVLFKAKLLSIHFLLPYYSLYTVTSAFFNKAYWLYLWETSQQQVDEMLQLLKAFEWSIQHEGHYAKHFKEIIKTSFLTSSNQSGNIKEFNMNSINHYLNNA
jgi:hypothetical protein